MGLFALGAACVSGCAVDNEIDVAGLKKSEASPSVELKGLAEPTAMALYHEGARTNSVKVGDMWASAKEVFPEPPRGTYEIHDLPNQFGKQFESQGWESDRNEGFGVILTDNKVVSAVYELEHARADTVDELIHDELTRMLPLKPTSISDGPVSYWFWHGINQTTMICRLETKDGVNLTMAMGDDNVLKPLAISEDDAHKQIAAIKAAAVLGK